MALKLNFKAFIFDIDGSLFRGDNPIKGAPEIIAMLRRRGKKILLLTNNSTGTPEGYAEKLAKMGINVSQDEILTSSMATADYMKKFKRGGVYVIGENALSSAISGEGFTILNEAKAKEAGYVVCGLDRHVTYDKLAAASYAIQNGAKFIAANADRNLPVEDGCLPGAGAILSVIIKTTNVRPLIVGKPSKRIMKIALDRLGMTKDEVAIVGDALETDIKAGRNSKIYSILVLTGVSKKEDLAASRVKPDLVLGSIAGLSDLL
jgi:4-nitrophenyl phosphatase